MANKLIEKFLNGYEVDLHKMQVIFPDDHCVVLGCAAEVSHQPLNKVKELKNDCQIYSYSAEKKFDSYTNQWSGKPVKLGHFQD